MARRRPNGFCTARYPAGSGARGRGALAAAAALAAAEAQQLAPGMLPGLLRRLAPTTDVVREPGASGLQCDRAPAAAEMLVAGV
jgi:hypothetical protein